MINKQIKLVFLVLVLGATTAPAAVPDTGRDLSNLDMSTRTMRSLARIYLTSGQYDKAEQMARQALDKAQAQSAQAGEMALCLLDLGTIYSQEGLLEEARQTLTRGIEYQSEALTGSHPYVASSLRMLSEVYRRQGRLDEARQTLTEAVTIMLDSHTPESREMVPFFLESANLLLARQDFDAADKTYGKTLEIAERGFGADHLLTASVLTACADLRVRTGRLESAQDMIDRALRIQDRCYHADHPGQVDAWLVKARLCRMQGDAAGLEACVDKAVRVTSQSRNVVAMANLYERINRLRTEDQVAAAIPQGR